MDSNKQDNLNNELNAARLKSRPQPGQLSAASRESVPASQISSEGRLSLNAPVHNGQAAAAPLVMRQRSGGLGSLQQKVQQGLNSGAVHNTRVYASANTAPSSSAGPQNLQPGTAAMRTGSVQRPAGTSADSVNSGVVRSAQPQRPVSAVPVQGARTASMAAPAPQRTAAQPAGTLGNSAIRAASPAQRPAAAAPVQGARTASMAAPAPQRTAAQPAGALNNSAARSASPAHRPAAAAAPVQGARTASMAAPAAQRTPGQPADAFSNSAAHSASPVHRSAAAPVQGARTGSITAPAAQRTAVSNETIAAGGPGARRDSAPRPVMASANSANSSQARASLSVSAAHPASAGRTSQQLYPSQRQAEAQPRASISSSDNSIAHNPAQAYELKQEAPHEAAAAAQAQTHAQYSSEQLPRTTTKFISKPSVKSNSDKKAKEQKPKKGPRTTRRIKPEVVQQAPDPEEVAREQAYKALLAKRVDEYNRIQAYYAKHMAVYEEEQKRLDALMVNPHTSDVEKAHIFDKQTEVYAKQQKIFQLQNSLYDLVSGKNYSPETELPFTPLNGDPNDILNADEANAEEHWSAILGGKLSKSGGKGQQKSKKNKKKDQGEDFYKIDKRHESYMDARRRRLAENERWKKKWDKYYKTDSFWRRQRYIGAFAAIVIICIVFLILNNHAVFEWMAEDYEVPMRPIETNLLKTNYQTGYLSVHNNDTVPTNSVLTSDKSPYNVMALRNGGSLRIDKFTKVTVNHLETSKTDESFMSAFYMEYGRICACSTPTSQVRLITPEIRIYPTREKPTLYCAAVKNRGTAEECTLLSVYRGACNIVFTNGSLDTHTVEAGQCVKAFTHRIDPPTRLRVPDKWIKWNYSWDSPKLYISPLATPKLDTMISDDVPEETPKSAVEDFIKKKKETDKKKQQTKAQNKKAAGKKAPAKPGGKTKKKK